MCRFVLSKRDILELIIEFISNNYLIKNLNEFIEYLINIFIL